MILTVLFLTLVSSCLAQTADKNVQQRSARAPQGQIQYSDPDGSRVDWKQYTPQTQQRSQRAESGTGQASFQQKQQVVQAPIEHQPQYQPYSAIPSHIKELLAQAYTPQGPYVDPGAFFYHGSANLPISSAAPQPKQDQSAFPQASADQSYFNSAVNYRAAGYAQSQQANTQQFGKVGGIKYKDEERVYQRSAELPYGSVISAQSQTKPQYQPYKQIQQSQQYSKQASQPQPQYQMYNKQAQPQPEYQMYNKQVQPQPQYQMYNKQVQPQPQYQMYNKQVQPQPQYQMYNKQVQPQYQQYNKQISQYQYQQLNKQASQPRLQYQQPNKQSQPQQYKQQSQLIKPVSEMNFDKNMPVAIQTLLNYQAQLPYNVIANHILYRPKQLFIPKPLPENTKFSGQYPNKVYFVKNDGELYDGPVTKDVKIEKRY